MKKEMQHADILFIDISLALSVSSASRGSTIVGCDGELLIGVAVGFVVHVHLLVVS